MLKVRHAVGSILCAAAQNSSTFIIGRAIAGIGAAGLFQGALGIIALSVALDKRPLYTSIVMSSYGISTAVGPVIGGVFTSNVTWRWSFWM